MVAAAGCKNYTKKKKKKKIFKLKMHWKQINRAV